MTTPMLAPPREVLPWDAPKSDWLAARIPAITATDISAICGVHPYRSAYEVWAEKVGDPFPDSAGEAAEIGLALEPTVAEMWARRPEGHLLARVGLLAHPEHDWMRCSPDRLAVSDTFGTTGVVWSDVLGLVEIKTALGWAHLNWGDDTVPDTAQFQVAWQMAVTGIDRGWLVALAGPSLKTYEVARDQQLIDDLMGIADRFLTENVAKRIPPAPDGSDRLAGLLAQRWQPDPDKTVVVDPGRFWPLSNAYHQALADERDAKERKTAAGNAIRLLLGDAEAAVIDGDNVATWKSGTRAGYTVAPTTTRTLRFTKAGKS